MDPSECVIWQRHHKRVGKGHHYVPKSPAHKKAYEKEMKAQDRAQERYSIKQGEYLQARIGSILDEARDAKKEWAKHVKFSPGRKGLIKDIEKVKKAAEALNKKWFANQNRKLKSNTRKSKGKPPDREKSRR